MFDKRDMPFVHRDISWLSFNYRVLQEAKDTSVPLLERIKFLGIYSSNLDEFFRVRVASIKTLIRLGKKTKSQMDFSPEIVLERIRQIVAQQQLEFGAIYKNEILPELAQHNIHIIRPKAIQSYHHPFLDRFFSEKLIQHAQPILLVKNKIRTFLPSNAIHLAVRLKTAGNAIRYAVVKIPTDALPRFVQLPDRGSGRREIMILDDILRYCLPRLFPGYSIRSAYSIKMTRDADIYIEDEYSGDLIDKIRKGIAKRNIGKGTRFVYDRKMSTSMLHFLTSTLHVKKGDLQPQGRYHNNFDFFKFPTFKLKHLQDIPLPALSHPELSGQDRLFSIIFKKDLLLHFPYQKYEYVIRLLEQAAHDPKVTTIKIAQYRVAKDSRIIAALRSAIEQGKSVMVFMEVKARFDEEANLYWAEHLESWGAKVVYSLPELKVHAKLLLILRGKRKYAYLGTGNFNESTSKIYSDYGFMTADRRITDEVETVFDFLEYKRRPKRPFKHLLVGQFRMRRNIYQLIEQEIEHAKAGRKALIIVKLNSLQDPRMISRLYEASNAGVKIKLIIRGICSLVPHQVGYSENIEVISIIDRYLEHTRVYYFYNNGDDQLYLSSADWMTRNLFYRIECAFPIYDAQLRREIKDFLDIQLKDNVKARIIDGKLGNQYKEDNASPWRSQHRLYLYYQKQLLPKIDQ